MAGIAHRKYLGKKLLKALQNALCLDASVKCLYLTTYKVIRQQLGLLKNRINGLLLHVRRIAIFVQCPFHQNHQLRPCAFPNRPVNRCIGLDLLSNFDCNNSKLFVAENVHCWTCFQQGRHRRPVPPLTGSASFLFHRVP